jgi:hypothetical protein
MPSVDGPGSNPGKVALRVADAENEQHSLGTGGIEGAGLVTLARSARMPPQSNATRQPDGLARSLGGTFAPEAGAMPSAARSTADFTIKPGTKFGRITVQMKTGDNKGKTWIGIYKVDGDSLEWCGCWKGENDLPTAFGTKKGDKYFLRAMKRQKD